MSATIRRAVEGDIPALAKLYEAFLDETLAGVAHARRNPELDAESAIRRLAGRECAAMFVAESAGAPVGFAFVEMRRAAGRRDGILGRLSDFLTRRLAFLPVLSPARGWLAHLYVAPQFRRQGAASALVRTAADWAKSQGAAALELNVVASNASARRLYEKLGMTATLVDYRMDV
jgi:GNAT superfamily N-acetyltransferase